MHSYFAWLFGTISQTYMAYTAKDITVLEGLDPVRRRPGMYIGGVGSAGLHHLVWEILDNSIDEAMNGHASTIWVTLHKDGSSITIEDDGRGIPIDKHPKGKKSALEVIFTVLHAGGKFDHDNYKTAGGLHGVGASVVNALSKELVATVCRDGAEWEQRFKQGNPGATAQRNVERAFCVRPPRSCGGGAMSWQKSAEGIVVPFDRSEGPNMKKRTGDSNFDD